MTENDAYVAFQNLFDWLSSEYSPEEIEDLTNGAFKEWMEVKFPHLVESDDDEG